MPNKRAKKRACGYTANCGQAGASTCTCPVRADAYSPTLPRPASLQRRDHPPTPPAGRDQHADQHADQPAGQHASEAGERKKRLLGSFFFQDSVPSPHHLPPVQKKIQNSYLSSLSFLSCPNEPVYNPPVQQLLAVDAWETGVTAAVSSGATGTRRGACAQGTRGRRSERARQRPAVPRL